MTAAVDAAREALIEMVAEADEKLMEKFFEAGTLTDEELVAGLRSATIGRQAVPAGLHLGAAQHRRAAAARRDRRATCRRRPIGRSRASTRTAPRSRAPPTTRRRPPAFVWKTIADPFAGRITMFRVVSGTLKADSTVHNKTQGRAGAPRPPAAAAGQDARRSVPEIKAGDLGAVAKLKDTLTNDTLGDKSDPVTFPAVDVSRAGARLRDRAEEPRRRGQDQHVDAPARGRGSVDPATAAIRRPRSCCSPARASCTSRSPSPS